MHRGLRIALAVLLAEASSACVNLDATVHNLRVMHPSPGRHAYVARTMSAGYYSARTGVAKALESLGATLAEADEQTIEDPTETCLELLDELSRFDSAKFGIASTQVELFTRIALYDPWALSREFAVTQLGAAGERISAGAEPRYAIAAEQPSDSQFALAKQRIVDAGLAALEQSDEARRTEFAAACEALVALGPDVDHALDVLAEVSVVLRSGSEADERLAPLRTLSLVLQRRLIDSALTKCFNDAAPSAASGSDPGWPNERVQAAAVAANVRVFGAPRLAEILMSNPFRSSESARLVAVLAEIERSGLPPVTEAQNQALSGDAHRYWIAAIVKSAAEHPEGRVQIGAMRALGKISGKGAFSLRYDDWFSWWIEYQARASSPQASSPQAGETKP